jgi:cytochrome c6
LKTTTRILALVFMLALTTVIVVPTQAADDAAATFKSKCAMCHGQDATGKTPMGARLGIKDLTSAEVQKQSDAELAGVITKGRNKMPAYGEKLSGDQIAGLVKYIRTLAKK